jgi:hypothetical protein
MTQYRDFYAYPLGLAFVYCLVALAMWKSNPGDWNDAARILWIIWAVAWGEALRVRIRKDVSHD